MANKVNLARIGSLTNETSAIQALNQNFKDTETAFDNTLSLDGSVPNKMTAPIDMNSNKIINLGVPSGDQDAVRLIDIENLIDFGSSSGFQVSAPGPQPFAEDDFPVAVGSGFVIGAAGGSCTASSTADVTFYLYIGGLQFASVKYPLGLFQPVFTGFGFTVPSNSFVRVVWPGTQDPTLKGISFFFKGI